MFRTNLLPFSPLGFVLLLILVYTLVQQVDNLWLRPQFLGRKLHLHPGVALIGLIGGLALGGLLGALLALPCLATLKILESYLHHKFLELPLDPQAALAGAGAERPAQGLSDKGEAERAAPVLRQPVPCITYWNSRELRGIRGSSPEFP